MPHKIKNFQMHLVRGCSRYFWTMRWSFERNPKGSSLPELPLFVVLLVQTPGLRCGARLNWHSGRQRYMIKNSVNRPLFYRAVRQRGTLPGQRAVW